MDAMLTEIRSRLGNSDDLFLLKDRIGETPVILIGLYSLIDLPQAQISLHQQKEYAERLADSSLSLGSRPVQDILSSLLQGMLLLYCESNQKALIVDPVPRNVSRSLETPYNENLLQGPITAFNEDMMTNIGMLRKQLTSSALRVKTFTFGTKQQKQVSLLFLEGTTDPQLVSRIQEKLESKLEKDVNQLQDLTSVMGLSSLGIISKFNTTELPHEATAYLNKGRVLLFLDRMPFAVVLPVQLWDMIAMENDRNYPLPIMVAIRTTRLLGILLTLLIPGLYVALVSVNPEVLRIELALSIAQSRSGVPYPALIEMILMLILLELILEASVRLPRSVGPTITMVGGIILGQAVVQAKLVSNLLIIVLAATTISNSTVVGFTNSLSIRFFKYLIVILAAIYGVLGILGGMVIISAYLGGISTFGTPYIQLPRRKGEIKNG